MIDLHIFSLFITIPFHFQFQSHIVFFQDDLTKAQQAAAKVLGYTKSTWDEEDDDDDAPPKKDKGKKPSSDTGASERSKIITHDNDNDDDVVDRTVSKKGVVRMGHASVPSSSRIPTAKPPPKPSKTAGKGTSDGRFTAEQVDFFENEIRTKGVTVIPKAFTKEEIARLSRELDPMWTKVKKQIEGKKANSDDVIYIKGDEEVVVLGKGRYDFTVGLDKGVFMEPWFYHPPIVKELAKRLLVEG